MLFCHQSGFSKICQQSDLRDIFQNNFETVFRSKVVVDGRVNATANVDAFAPHSAATTTFRQPSVAAMLRQRRHNCYARELEDSCYASSAPRKLGSRRVK